MYTQRKDCGLERVLLFVKWNEVQEVRKNTLKKGKKLSFRVWSWETSKRATFVLAFKICTKCHFEPHNLMVLEVREEILRAQVNNKRCDAERLAIGTVNEKTTYSGKRAEKQKLDVNFRAWLKLKLHLNFSALSAASGIFIVKRALLILWRYETSNTPKVTTF